MSFFSVKNYADEFLTALDKNFKGTVSADTVDDETVAATADEIIENTRDYILKELSRNLKGYDLEEFVADLLSAMGYRTTISPHEILLPIKTSFRQGYLFRSRARTVILRKPLYSEPNQ